MKEYFTKPIFKGYFTNIDDIIDQFCIKKSELKNCQIHYAEYDCGNYDGSAIVIFEKNNVLYEVNGRHCSCYGLEGQWEPEQTTWEALSKRLWLNEDKEFQTLLKKIEEEERHP